MKRVCILHPSYEDSDAPFRGLDPQCVPGEYLPKDEFDCKDFFIGKKAAIRQVTDIIMQNKFDLVVNLCDGALDEDRPGLEVIQTLERLNAAFTGAHSQFFEPTREAMKMACHSVGVKFPAYVMAHDVEGAAERALKLLRFPMIVKHPNSYSSVGLTRASRVTDADSLRKQLQLMIDTYSSALIEEFIEGREYTVLVTEGRERTEAAWALHPVEFVFNDGETFKHFDLKWKEFQSMDVKAIEPGPLCERLKQDSAAMFAALNGSGYGRCDIRVDAQGDIYMLEINPNCGIFYPASNYGSADFAIINDPEVKTQETLLRHLFDCAVRRQKRFEKNWEIQFVPKKGFGLYAIRDVAAGEIVEKYEERAQVLVSKQHVERNWGDDDRKLFASYAFPMSENVFGTWSENPDDWRPLNHSCDSNVWFSGLNVVASRDIAKGEEFCLDYATFCAGSYLTTFECHCGAADCRNRVTGDDYKLPKIRERFFPDHVSDYIRQLLIKDSHN